MRKTRKLCKCRQTGTLAATLSSFLLLLKLNLPAQPRGPSKSPRNFETDVCLVETLS